MARPDADGAAAAPADDADGDKGVDEAADAPDPAAVEALAGHLADAGRALAFTGAGASTESGIPDFRGDEGLWKRHPADDLHISRFHADPAAFWETWLALHDEVVSKEPQPNPVHRVLADWVAAGRLTAIVTQNGDGLHQAAGAPDDAVVELHGTFRRGVCLACGAEEAMADLAGRVRQGEVPPTCGACGGTVKPGAVLFGEALPAAALESAQGLALASDVFLVVGSSLVVHPAASLPRLAQEAGATLAIVNLEKTPLDDRADVVVHGKAGPTLQAVAKALDGGDAA